MQTLIQDLLGFNGSLFTTIHTPAGHTPLVDNLMPIVASDALYLFPILILLLWWIPGSKSPAARAERSVSHEAVVWTVVAVALALIGNVALGALIPEPRPFISFHFTPLVAHPADASFPSDHAAVTFAITGILLIRFWLAYRRPALPPVAPYPPKPYAQRANSAQGLSGPERSGLLWRTGILAALGLLLAIAIGYARVYVGVHYPLDIIGGAIIGLVAALIVALARGLLKPVARLVESGAHLVHLA